MPAKLVGSCKGQLRILADVDSEPAIPDGDWDMLAGTPLATTDRQITTRAKRTRLVPSVNPTAKARD